MVIGGIDDFQLLILVQNVNVRDHVLRDVNLGQGFPIGVGQEVELLELQAGDV